MSDPEVRARGTAIIYHVPDMPVCLVQEESRYIRCIFTVFQVFGHQKSVSKFDLSLFSRSLYPIYNVQKGLAKRLGQQNCVAKLDLSLYPRSLYPISTVRIITSIKKRKV